MVNNVNSVLFQTIIKNQIKSEQEGTSNHVPKTEGSYNILNSIQ